MRYLSLFSGIEAASLAWETLGWEPMAFAEIEPFPSQVLSIRWPAVENLGDVTAVDWKGWLEECGRPDVMVAGPPCQAFSVAGGRMSLEDARGNLTLFTAELVRFLEPRYYVWENVPGALNTRDNAFGCLLGELVGAGEALSPTGKRWTNAGLVSGPEATAAWRVLDAQYFGVAQRRRRLFVVRCPRDGADPAAVLFEPEGVRWDSSPRSQARKGAASATASGTRGGSLLADTGVVRGLKARFGTSGSDLDDAEAGHIVAPTYWDGSDTTDCLDSSKMLKQQMMPEKNRFAAVIEPQPPIAIQDGREMEKRQNGLGISDEGVSYTIDQTGSQSVGVVEPIAFKPSHYTSGKDGAPSDVVPPLMKEDDRGDQEPVILTPEVADPISASEGKTYTHEGEHNFRLHNVVGGFRTGQSATSRNVSYEEDMAPTLEGGGGGNNRPAIHSGMAVRRLTPRECERLQGMPDDHTRITWRGKAEQDCPDGPRYKAIGNSMAVPVMAWIGRRIQRVEGVSDGAA